MIQYTGRGRFVLAVKTTELTADMPLAAYVAPQIHMQLIPEGDKLTEFTLHGFLIPDEGRALLLPLNPYACDIVDLHRALKSSQQQERNLLCRIAYLEERLKGKESSE